jgi:hypothetical protein
VSLWGDIGRVWTRRAEEQGEEDDPNYGSGETRGARGYKNKKEGRSRAEVSRRRCCFIYLLWGGRRRTASGRLDPLPS